MKNILTIIVLVSLIGACKKSTPVTQKSSPPSTTSNMNAVELSLVGKWFEDKRVGYQMSGTTPMASDSTFFNNPVYYVEFTTQLDTLKTNIIYPGYHCNDPNIGAFSTVWTANSDTLRNYGAFAVKWIIKVTGTHLTLEQRGGAYPTYWNKYWFHK